MFGTLPDEKELRKYTPASALPANAHVHLPPNFGAITRLDELFAHARQEDIAVLGACNYYDHTIYTPFAHACIQQKIVPVFGIEILTMDEPLRSQGILVNDPKNPGKLYLCGKGLTHFDKPDDESRALWENIRQGDARRIRTMLAQLNQIQQLCKHGIRLSYEMIAAQVAADAQVPESTVFLQERHLAQALQRRIFDTFSGQERMHFLQTLYQLSEEVESEHIVTVQNELRSYLLKQGRAAYVDEHFVSPQDAAELIHGLGGYVSYPVLADGMSPISPFERPPDELAERLLQRQIAAVEFIPTRNEATLLTQYVTAIREHGLAVAAGTEHNTAVWLPLTPACRQQIPPEEPIAQIFWEGACVAIAHQYMRAKGQAGYRFVPQPQARDTLIREMATLGARIVTYFAQSNS